jgi:hypothetical protein
MEFSTSYSGFLGSHNVNREFTHFMNIVSDGYQEFTCEEMTARPADETCTEDQRKM